MAGSFGARRSAALPGDFFAVPVIGGSDGAWIFTSVCRNPPF
jgi:hypothetical protein